MKKIIVFIMTCLMGVCLVTGCAPSKKNIWEVKFDNVNLNIDQTFEGLLSDIIDSDHIAIDYVRLFVYEKDGSASKEKKVNYLEDEPEKWVTLTHKKSDDEELTDVIFYNRNKNLKYFKSADGIDLWTKESDLQSEYVPFGRWNSGGWNGSSELSNYTVLVVDGKYQNISKFLKETPDTMTEEYWGRINEISFSAEEYQLHPDFFKGIEEEDFKSYFNSDEYCRNATAFGFAVYDAVTRFNNEEINTVGTISYSFENGEMVSCEFKILRAR